MFMGRDEAMAYIMTAKEEKIWRRELEETEYYFLQNELRNEQLVIPDEYRRYLEQRVEELGRRFEPERFRDVCKNNPCVL